MQEDFEFEATEAIQWDPVLKTQTRGSVRKMFSQTLSPHLSLYNPH